MSKQVYLVWLVFFPHTYSVQQKPRWSWNGMAGEWRRVTASPSRRRTDGRWLERKTWCHLQETCLNSFPNFLPALNTFNLHAMINTQSGANLCRSIIMLGERIGTSPPKVACSESPPPGKRVWSTEVLGSFSL